MRFVEWLFIQAEKICRAWDRACEAAQAMWDDNNNWPGDGLGGVG